MWPGDLLALIIVIIRTILDFLEILVDVYREPAIYLYEVYWLKTRESNAPAPIHGGWWHDLAFDFGVLISSTIAWVMDVIIWLGFKMVYNLPKLVLIYLIIASIIFYLTKTPLEVQLTYLRESFNSVLRVRVIMRRLCAPESRYSKKVGSNSNQTTAEQKKLAKDKLIADLKLLLVEWKWLLENWGWLLECYRWLRSKLYKVFSLRWNPNKPRFKDLVAYLDTYVWNYTHNTEISKGRDDDTFLLLVSDWFGIHYDYYTSIREKRRINEKQKKKRSLFMEVILLPISLLSWVSRFPLRHRHLIPTYSWVRSNFLLFLSSLLIYCKNVLRNGSVSGFISSIKGWVSWVRTCPLWKSWRAWCDIKFSIFLFSFFDLKRREARFYLDYWIACEQPYKVAFREWLATRVRLRVSPSVKILWEPFPVPELALWLADVQTVIKYGFGLFLRVKEFLYWGLWWFVRKQLRLLVEGRFMQVYKKIFVDFVKSTYNRLNFTAWVTNLSVVRWLKKCFGYEVNTQTTSNAQPQVHYDYFMFAIEFSDPATGRISEGASFAWACLRVFIASIAISHLFYVNAVYISMCLFELSDLAHVCWKHFDVVEDVWVTLDTFKDTTADFMLAVTSFMPFLTSTWPYTLVVKICSSPLHYIHAAWTFGTLALFLYWYVHYSLTYTVFLMAVCQLAFDWFLPELRLWIVALDIHYCYTSWSLLAPTVVEVISVY